MLKIKELFLILIYSFSGASSSEEGGVLWSDAEASKWGVSAARNLDLFPCVEILFLSQCSNKHQIFPFSMKQALEPIAEEVTEQSGGGRAMTGRAKVETGKSWHKIEYVMFHIFEMH